MDPNTSPACVRDGGVMTAVLTMSRRHAALSPAQSIGHDCKSTPESVTQYLSRRPPLPPDSVSQRPAGGGGADGRVKGGGRGDPNFEQLH